MTINQLLAALTDELAEGGVPDPLNQRFRLDFVWADLARIAGEALPAEIARALDAPIRATPPRRGPCADHRAPFAEAYD